MYLSGLGPCATPPPAPSASAPATASSILLPHLVSLRLSQPQPARAEPGERGGERPRHGIRLRGLLREWLGHRDELPKAAGARLVIFARGFKAELRQRAAEKGVALVGIEELF
jgi:hypothetical protein